MRLPKTHLPEVKLPKLKLPIRLLLYLATVILSGLSMLVASYQIISSNMAIIIYVPAACILGLSSGYLYRDIRYGVNEKLMAGIEKNPLANRITTDYRYRTVLSTYSTLTTNTAYALGNAVYGIINHSVWLGSMAAYYIMLSIMRFIVIQYERKSSKIKNTQKVKRHELALYQISGLLFILLTVALGASVMQMVYYYKGHSYPGFLIFAVAAYTFYKIVVAVINIIKAGRLKSPLIMTIRDIGYAEALVSLLSLQTAMFVSFGSGDSISPQLMNSLTGGFVCLMILIMGIYMTVSAAKQKKTILEKI